MLRLPYSTSSFDKLRREQRYYADRTQFIEFLEAVDDSYILLMRPRRFGKSLFLSVLHHYYGIEHKDQFEELFAPYYIGQHPTPLANKYLVINFDFSQIVTTNPKTTLRGFLFNVKESAKTFFATYPTYFDQQDIAALDNLIYPSEVIQHLIGLVQRKVSNHLLYILIDEYDHFANELLAFHFKDFEGIVGTNGFVRKFYEAIKVGTQTGTVDRIFITGVSPVTLDSLTSGFNIGTNISTLEGFNEIVGFTEPEVSTILTEIGVKNTQLASTLADVRQWYDGYLFHEDATNRIYNPTMVLYFAMHYNRNKKYPKELLDTNIASDYGKVSQIFKIGGKEKDNLHILDDLLKNGQLRAKLTRQFNFKTPFTRDDLVSMLYYNGIVSIMGQSLEDLIFRMPNYVIQQLYYQYFHQLTLEKTHLDTAQIRINDKVQLLAQKNTIQPLIDHTQNILTELSNRDKQQFDEKHIKVIFTSLFYQVGYYTILNEYEVKKNDTEKGYIDLLLLRRPPFHPNFQFIFELKYLSKKNANHLPSTFEEASVQLEEYLQDSKIQQIKDLKRYVVVFVGNKGHFKEI